MKVSFLFLTLLLFFQAQAFGFYYLKAESVDLANFPAPPELNSRDDMADLEMVLFHQSSRSTEDCARALSEAPATLKSFFGEAYGPLTNDEANKLSELHERIFQDVQYFSKVLKDTYSRQRPFVRDERVKPCIPFEASPSYPSGHATLAVVSARAMALIYPAKKDAFLFRADAISQDRVLAGVHHPLDILAGKKLGEKIFQALILEPAFLDDVKAFAP